MTCEYRDASPARPVVRKSKKVATSSQITAVPGIAATALPTVATAAQAKAPRRSKAKMAPNPTTSPTIQFAAMATDQKAARSGNARRPQVSNGPR